MGFKTSFYLSNEARILLDKYTVKHGSVSGAVVRALITMDNIFRYERKVLKKIFTPEDLQLLSTVCTAKKYLPESMLGKMEAELEDANLLPKYKEDKAVLLEKIQGLTETQEYALADILVSLEVNQPKKG